MRPVAHITVKGVPLCQCFGLKGVLYYAYKGDQAVYCGLLKCQYDSHWDANDAATYMLGRMMVFGVESLDGPCPSDRHVPPFVSCLWCQTSFKYTLAFEMHQYVGCGKGSVVCWRCRKEFGSPNGLNGHYQIHLEEEERDQSGSVVKRGVTPLERGVTPLEAFAQHRREGAGDYSAEPRRSGYNWERYSWYDWEEGSYYISPDLATGERGLCDGE